MSRHMLITILVLAFASALFAEVPRTISYQGRLTDNGIPVNGLKGVRFKIYDRSSNPIWNSGSVNVTFTDGLFTVELGQSPQTPLPSDIWPSDTAMTLGVTISPNPELTPRLHFKTVPYAMHALTAESANSAGGWLHAQSEIRMEDSSDHIILGGGTTAYTPAMLTINQLGDEQGLLVDSKSKSTWAPGLVVNSTTSGATLHSRGDQTFAIYPMPAVFASSDGDSGIAAWFMSNSVKWPTVIVQSDSTAGAILADGQGFGLDSWAKQGIRAVADSATTIRAESNCSDGAATVLSSTYTGTAVRDHIAISGYSHPWDYYGVGGTFEGGFKGIEGAVKPTGSQYYFGVRGVVSGGTGNNYGVDASATGQGNNVALLAYAGGGTTNWAGFFNGDVTVTGNIVKAASTFAIDHPTDPENEYLQQAEVISNEMKAVYDGTVVFGSDGTAIVQLPDYLESFCGDFRYQLTCIGGYAPVYVSSKITNSKFAIAGGTPGLEVSWQITGIRKDKYAQANPLEVEKKKTVSEQGKYLHPELYGYDAEKSLSPNPTMNAEMKAKDDAIRAATEALKKPSTPPAMPQIVEKK